MAKKASIYAGLAVIVLAGLFSGGYWVVGRRSQEVCGFCQRHINPKARVIASVGNETRSVCCAHCAVSEARQERKPLRFIEVTDYNTGQTLDPADAWFVDGSRVVACEHDMSRMDESKHAEPLAFDRCSPGTFAFRDQPSAAAFVRENGGVLRRLPDLLKEAEQQ